MVIHGYIALYVVKRLWIMIFVIIVDGKIQEL